jgi:hypothetical protein
MKPEVKVARTGKQSLIPNIFFIFFILIVGFVVYYLFFRNPSSNDSWSTIFFPNESVKSVDYDAASVSESYGFGVYQSYAPEVGMNVTRFLQENESLEGYARITNAMYTDNQYLLFMLVDYRTVPFYVEGNKGLTHLLALKPMEDNFYSFKLDNLSKGYHDVILGVFLNPYEHSLGTNYRMSTDFALMGRIRLNVIVSNSYYPLPEFNTPRISCEKNYALEGLLVTTDSCSHMGWFSENVSKEQKLNYFINLGNNNDDQRTFALIQFLDYQQIPLHDNSSDYVYYGYLSNGGKASIPASLIAPNATGVHELIAVWVSDPYNNLEISPGVINDRIEGRIEPSIRVGLSVT